MVRGDGGGEQKRGRKRVKNNSESAKKRRERSRITSAASFQGLRARDLGYGSPAQKAARKHSVWVRVCVCGRGGVHCTSAWGLLRVEAHVHRATVRRHTLDRDRVVAGH